MQLYVIFLGTGGSWPTVKRNVTSIAVKRGREVILFDCGEGTQRQIQRSELSYMQVTKIFITHFHGDHFLGLPGLIQTMQLNDRVEPLFIYGPKGVKRIVETVTSIGYFKPSYPISVVELTDGDRVRCEGYTVKAMRVDHTVPTFAYALEEDIRPGRFNKSKALELGVPEGPLFSRLQRGENITLNDGRVIEPSMVLGPPRRGRKIVFSGDTRPCKRLIKFAYHADILIHDATFDSELEETANEYGHSTARQAAAAAEKAEVKQLILVHISPRYLDVRPLQKEAQEVFPNTMVAHDFTELEVKLEK
ncbi:MAG TPA: ribonuclease Z [Thermoplasmata archaeon]|nr:ribonuclease Z [Thermoplasmata archaeon]